MADTWRRKGVMDYRREAALIPEHAIIEIIEQYVTTPDDIAEIIRESRKVIEYCLIARHGDDSPAPSDISRAVLKVRKQALDLSTTLSVLSPRTKDRIREAANNDCDLGVIGLARGDPFAQEARFEDAAIAVDALARWASEVQGIAGRAKRGRPVKDAPAACVTALGRFYQRLTGVTPSRVTRQAEAPPYGHIEHGDFGRFARDFSALIGVRLSDDALKRGIARLKVKKGFENGLNSPLDATVLIDPEKIAEAQEGPERMQGSSQND